jgi:hypothetical protein
MFRKNPEAPEIFSKKIHKKPERKKSGRAGKFFKNFSQKNFRKSGPGFAHQ